MQSRTQTPKSLQSNQKDREDYFQKNTSKYKELTRTHGFSKSLAERDSFCIFYIDTKRKGNSNVRESAERKGQVVLSRLEYEQIHRQALNLTL